MDAPFILNMILLLGVVVLIRGMERNGRMTANRFGLITVAFLSYFVLSAFHSGTESLSPGAIRFEIFLFFGIWIIGYPLARWMYGQWKPKDS